MNTDHEQGFGGTNAHCILENYDTTKTELTVLSTPHHPFVFSATSKKTLLMVLQSYMTYLSTRTVIDLRALSHTLCVRRTAHPFRISLSARDTEELRVKLESVLQKGDFNPTAPAPSLSVPVRILGIFTGQGAQWSGMARVLMQIPAAAQITDSLEHNLATLQDPPSWSLKAEISADASSSRVTEAAIAQPVCTAVQILLVEILRAAGIRFSTVVGHSSGEIAAAYAAGHLSSKDAIRIAYYRGVHLPLVGGKNGERGSMVAIGASYEEAQEICGMEQFRGKICVAACNSAASVTLSGDITAVEAVKDMLHAQNKFARLLRVGNACKRSTVEI
jgi:hybrid polyketide synthase/nonribosomal peptide synthetase ACE1